jgi:hypothetical protein
VERVEHCCEAAQGAHLVVLKWAREQDCPWDLINVVRSPRGAGTLRWCDGHVSTAARGTGGRLTTPLGAGTWRCCGGRRSATARGTSRSVSSIQRATREIVAWVRQQPEQDERLCHVMQTFIPSQFDVSIRQLIRRTLCWMWLCGAGGAGVARH